MNQTRCDIPQLYFTKEIYRLIDGNKMTYHALMYLACEQMMVGIKQLQKKKWARQLINGMCTRARQPTDILCTGIRQLPMV